MKVLNGKDYFKELKLKLEELGFKVNWELYEEGGYEDDFYIKVNNKIEIFEGAYLKWDIYIEEEDVERSFKEDKELIEFISNNI